jgi:hypothetical protein
MSWFPFDMPLLPQCIILSMTFGTILHAVLPTVGSKIWFARFNQMNFILLLFWLLHYASLMHHLSS